ASSDPLLRVERQRLAFAEQQLAAGSAALPLLSTPTHAPHWLAPTALVQRLLAYEAARQEPDTADLSLALARCACWAPAETAAARPLLPHSAAPLAPALPWLWVVAARTRYPEAVFEELQPLADCPGVAAPWQPGWRFEPMTYSLLMVAVGKHQFLAFAATCRPNLAALAPSPHPLPHQPYLWGRA
nr:hypothetical protein [Tanacetum cinerariifolium]